MRNRLAVLLLALAGAVPAGEPEAPLTVTADSVDADRAREVSVFLGSVRVDKGGVHIEADEVRLRAKAGVVQEGTLLGNPVKFRQQTPDAPLVEGEARRIEYDAVNRVVVLTGNAWVRQNGDEIRSETIRYDLDNRRVVATSNASAPERVRLVLQPATEPGTEDGNGGA